MRPVPMRPVPMRTVTVVGASLAGLSAARALRAYGYDGRIEIVGAERHRPYDRPPLSKEFLAGTVAADDLALESAEDEALDLHWRLGRSAVQLEPANRAVVLDTGERLVADGVVVATGARARQFPGPRLAGVHTLRTLDDAVELRARLEPGVRLAVIGAGFIGAEVASTARRLGAEVTVVEAAPVPLAGPLGEEMGRVCAALHAENGVRLIAGAGGAVPVGAVPVDAIPVDAIPVDGGRVRAVRLADGTELPADLVVAGIGSVPCVDWLAGSGLRIDGGVLTDERCATAIPGVVAVGDCALSPSRYAGGLLRAEHWTHAQQQPAVAAATLLGHVHRPAPLADVPYFWSDQYGVRLQFAGHRRAGDIVEVTDGDLESRRFVAVYRRGARPAAPAVAVLAMNQSKPFARWRRELTRSTSPALA
jgi:3-phenylpropionate/trans-cinnamate dioxygenase ferredoxin reductase component